MNKNKYSVIGVMSGTSLDGIDLAHIHFEYKDCWSFDILDVVTVPYTDYWRERLKSAIYLEPERTGELNLDYTVLLGETIKKFILDKKIDLVCSHGHTVHHKPEEGYTLQIGNTSLLHKIVEKPIICNYRVQDVQLGGQGAPLVPIGDRLLFSEFDYCINLGGFANVSHELHDNRIAYDICPINVVLNHYVSKLGFSYDDGGRLSSEGVVETTLLGKLNTLSYYNMSPPKSLGLEWVLDNVIPIIDSFQMPVEDILRTFVEHASIQIAKCIGDGDKSVLVTGGGAYNTFLINRIQALSNQTIVIPEPNIIEFKEALIFGLLGVLKWRKEINVLSSVTGAQKDHSSGQIFM